MSGGRENQEKGPEAERYAHELASSKYFGRWCHITPFPLDDRSHELTDLLIVWGDVVIIFSIKNCEFKGNYVRHQRKTVEDGIRQISGAHRKLLRQPSFTVMDGSNRRTVTISDYPECKIFRVVLNLGEPVLFYYAMERDQVGNPVHVFDRAAFDGIVQELDTIPELVDYLSKRQDWLKDKEFFMSPGDESKYTNEVNEQFEKDFPKREDSPHRHFSCTGHELDLLSAFLRNGRAWPENFVSSVPKGAVIDYAGEWDRLNADPRFIKRKEADRLTRLVDALITEVLENPENERMALELSYLTRYDRRQLAQSLFGFLGGNHPQEPDYLARRFVPLDRYDMVFVHFGGRLPEEMLKAALLHICDVYRYRKSYEAESRSIMILACDPGSPLRQYAMVHYNERFDPEHERFLDGWIRENGWFMNERVLRTTQNEYPDESGDWSQREG